MTTIAIAAVVVLLFAIAVVRAFVRSNEWPPLERCASYHFQYRCSLSVGHIEPHRTTGDHGTSYEWSDP